MSNFYPVFTLFFCSSQTVNKEACEGIRTTSHTYPKKKNLLRPLVLPSNKRKLEVNSEKNLKRPNLQRNVKLWKKIFVVIKLPKCEAIHKRLNSLHYTYHTYKRQFYFKIYFIKLNNIITSLVVSIYFIFDKLAL